MPTTTEQRAALITEVQTAIGLIQAGLREVQRINGAYDFYHLLMLSLAGGFERLLKTIICLHALNETDSFPPPSAVWRGSRGHDLKKFLAYVTEECFNQAYLERVPAARKDVEFLRSDPRLSRIVGVLSRFGQAARYHDLDVILGATPVTDSPNGEWTTLESEILREHPDWAEMLTGGQINAAYEFMTTDIVKRIEILARALCRLFTIGGLGDFAKQQTGSIAPFLFLQDDQLATRRY